MNHSQSYNTIEDICEQFFNIEDKHDLLNWEIEGVKLWQYMRMPIYYIVAQKLGIISEPHPSPKLSFVSKLVNHSIKFKNALFKNPFISLPKVKCVILSSERSVNFNGESIDVYTYSLVKSLEALSIDHIILEKSQNERHLRKLNSKIRYLDYFSLRIGWNRYFLRKHTSSKVISEIKKIACLIDQYFEIQSDILKTLLHGLQRFKSNYSAYRKMLSRINPSLIFLVVGYLHGDLIKAAKDLGIQSIELQHGTFSKYHLGYSYTRRCSKLDYFPDKFLAWGTFWTKLIEWPISMKNVGLYQYWYFHELRKKYSHFQKIPTQIVVLSQGAVAKVLADKILEVSHCMSEYQIFFKLHPSEYGSWSENHSLVQLVKQANINLVTDEIELYQLFAESTYQIGVFSTALYEGIGMGCKTLLFDLPGIEYMEKLIKSGYATLIRNDDNFIEKMNKLNQNDFSIHNDEIFGLPELGENNIKKILNINGKEDTN